MRLRNVTFNVPVAMSGGMPIKDTISMYGSGTEVALIDNGPWVLVKTPKGFTGVTTIFNIVSRAVEDSDLEALTAPSNGPTEQVSPAKRR
jgi:hypothetical protein